MRLNLPTLIAALAISGSMSAQIVINKTDFTVNTQNNTYKRIVTGSTILQTGQNKVWNLRDQNDTIPATFTKGNRNSLFTKASVVYTNDYSSVAGQFSVKTVGSYGYTANGFAQTGLYIEKGNRFGLGSFTTNPSDSLKFAQGENVVQFQENIRFNQSYGSSWGGTSRAVTNFTLSIAAFGLNNAPGQYIARTQHSSRVAGWGEALLPKSITTKRVKALLIVTSITNIDSIYLNGIPAPAPLLSALGVVQGRLLNDSSYYLYTSGLSYELAVQEFNMGSVSSTDINRNANNSTSTVGILDAKAQMNVEVYPNPVTEGFVNINIPLGGSTFYITDMSGKIVRTIMYPTAGLQTVALSDLNPGVYILNLNTGSQMLTERLIIK